MRGRSTLADFTAASVRADAPGAAPLRADSGAGGTLRLEGPTPVVRRRVARLQRPSREPRARAKVAAFGSALVEWEGDVDDLVVEEIGQRRLAGLEVHGVEAGDAAHVEDGVAEVVDRHAIDHDAVDVEAGGEPGVDAEAAGGDQVGCDAAGDAVGR